MKTKQPFTHLVKITLTKTNHEFVGWLVDQMGPGGIQANSKWDTYPHLSEIDYNSDVEVYFRDDQDAALFALRWL